MIGSHDRRPARRRRRRRDRRARQLRPRPARPTSRRRMASGPGRAWSTATSATASRCAEAMQRRRRACSTRRRSASPSAPRSPGWRSRCWSTARSTCSRRRSTPASARSVAASSASVYGLAEEFPTTERHHPYDNRTLYGAAKAFNEGLLRSFHDMYGLDYVALRYFNVYGPRMDIHGVYTEVLIRWMERIAAGEPPLILGDGTADDGLRLRRRHRPGQHRSPPTAPVTDEVFNVGQRRPRPACASWPTRCCG